MKRWFFFFSLILFSCNNDSSFYSNKTNLENYSITEAVRFSENPAEFKNKKIQLSGEFYIDFEHIYLIIENKKIYLDFNFYKKLKDKNGKELDGEKLLSFNGKQIVVKGKYINGITGHINCCEGKLIEIAYFGNP